MTDTLIDVLLDRAREYGIEISGLQNLEQGESMTIAKIRRRKQTGEYLALLSPHMSMGDSYPHQSWGGHPLLVLGARVTPRNADRLRELGINYLDANGNAYLAFADVLIDIRGRSGNAVAELQRSKPVTSNLFSPKRAQVIFALLSWPELVSAKLQDLARSADVSVGFAQKTLVDLAAANYISDLGSGRHGRELVNVDALTDGWVAAFPGGLGSPSRTRAFRGDFNPDDLEPTGPPVYLSGEAVADWIRGHATWTLYTEPIPSEAAQVGRWRIDSSAPNIFVRAPFWKEPPIDRPAVFSGRVRNAPPLLVYADLLASGDSRQREAAHTYRSDHARLHAH